MEIAYLGILQVKVKPDINVDVCKRGEIFERTIAEVGRKEPRTQKCLGKWSARNTKSHAAGSAASDDIKHLVIRSSDGTQHKV